MDSARVSSEVVRMVPSRKAASGMMLLVVPARDVGDRDDRWIEDVDRAG